jgi:putative tryptophan/tyrosine transport system substrate-binding protein
MSWRPRNQELHHRLDPWTGSGHFERFRWPDRQMRRESIRARNEALRILRLMMWATAAIVIAGCSASPAGPAKPSASNGTKHVTVGIFLFDDSSFVPPVINGFKQGFLKTSKLSVADVRWDVQNAADNSGLVTSIARRYSTSSDAVVAVLGTPAVIALAQLDKLRPPIVAIAMGDPVGAGVARTVGHPGGNVTGTTDFIPPSRLLQILLQADPRPKKLGTVYDSSDQNMTVWIADLRAALAQTKGGPSLVAVPVNDVGQVAPAVASLAGRVDTILIGPDAIVAGDGLPAVAKFAAEARIPLYVAGGELTAAGITGTIGANYVQLGQQAGSLAAEVAGGVSPAGIGFAGPQSLQIEFSRSSLKADKVHFPASFMRAVSLGS